VANMKRWGSAASALLILTGCTQQQPVNTGSSPVMQSGNIAASVQMSAPGQKPKDGKPGKPQDNPNDFQLYALSIPFGEGIPTGDIIDQQLDCETNCDATHTTAHIRIVPSNYAPDVEWDPIVNPNPGNRKNGHFVAKISNLSDYPFPPLNMDANDVAFLWIGENGSSNNLRASLYRFGPSGAQKLREAKVLICRKPKGSPAVHLYASMDCREGAASTASADHLIHLASNSKHDERTSMVHTSGLWVSCSEGCCQVQFAVQ